MAHEEAGSMHRDAAAAAAPISRAIAAQGHGAEAGQRRTQDLPDEGGATEARQGRCIASPCGSQIMT